MAVKINERATGLAIKQKCNEYGVTPKMLSEALDISVTAPYLWFSGKAMPKTEHLLVLSRMLDCSIEDLLVTDEV